MEIDVKAIRIAAAAGLFASLGACATVTRGTNEAMVIETDPVGATVTIDNGKTVSNLTCNTPCSVKLPRKHPLTVSIVKDGYEPLKTQVLPQVTGGGGAGMAGNVILGGVVGAGVDAVSGAMKSFQPNPLTVTLVPVSGEGTDEPEVATGAQ
jgi:hypothetical protein